MSETPNPRIMRSSVVRPPLSAAVRRCSSRDWRRPRTSTPVRRHSRAWLPPWLPASAPVRWFGSVGGYICREGTARGGGRPGSSLFPRFGTPSTLRHAEGFRSENQDISGAERCLRWVRSPATIRLCRSHRAARPAAHRIGLKRPYYRHYRNRDRAARPAAHRIGLKLPRVGGRRIRITAARPAAHRIGLKHVADVQRGGDRGRHGRPPTESD
jgi:hypothetical protein